MSHCQWGAVAVLLLPGLAEPFAGRVNAGEDVQPVRRTAFETENGSRFYAIGESRWIGEISGEVVKYFESGQTADYIQLDTQGYPIHESVRIYDHAVLFGVPGLSGRIWWQPRPGFFGRWTY